MMALEEWAYNEFEWPKYYNYRPPLILDGSKGFKSLSNSSRKFFPLESDAWKSILHCEHIKLLSVFLQKSQDDLEENNSVKTILLMSLSTE